MLPELRGSGVLLGATLLSMKKLIANILVYLFHTACTLPALWLCYQTICALATFYQGGTVFENYPTPMAVAILLDGILLAVLILCGLVSLYEWVARNR